MKNLKVIAYCSIRNNTIKLNDKTKFAKDPKLSFLEFAKKAYKNYVLDYPKFFKMDNLSKLAFLASDVLFKSNKIKIDNKEDMAIVLSNRSSSLDTDRKHQTTIIDQKNYYPSPGLFVYTLPNISIGEISIRHKIKGENAFFVSDKFNAEVLIQYTISLIKNKKSNFVLCGWVDYDEKKYNAFMYIVSMNGIYKHSKEFLEKIYNSK